MNPDGYPDNWQSLFPGPWPLGMPIWLDSWGPQPPLVYYGNGTTTPGPLLPGRYIAETTINYNAGRGPALEPIPLEVMFTSSAPPPSAPRDERLTEIFRGLPRERFSDFTTSNPPVGAAEMASPIFRTLTQPSFATGITPYGGGQVYNRAGDIISAASGLCDSLPPGYKQACQAAAAVGQAVVGGATGAVAGAVMSAGGLGPQGQQGAQCPQGWSWSNVLGRCVDLSSAAPGGVPMTLTRNTAMTGGMGLTAVTPIQVGTITRNDGSSGPILRCPRRYVLGQDYLCYPKSMIPNQLRAHPRGTRPLLTGGEVKILRRAKGLEKKVTKLGHQFGKKVCHCGPTKTRRKK